MILYEPQLLLVQNADESYFLHVTTYVDRIDIQADGHQLPEELTEDGYLIIEAYLTADSDPNNNGTGYFIPVTHRVDLGHSFGGEFEVVEVRIYLREPSTSGNGTNIQRVGSASRPRTTMISKPFQNGFNH